MAQVVMLRVARCEVLHFQFRAAVSHGYGYSFTVTVVSFAVQFHTGKSFTDDRALSVLRGLQSFTPRNSFTSFRSTCSAISHGENGSQKRCQFRGCGFTPTIVSVQYWYSSVVGFAVRFTQTIFYGSVVGFAVQFHTTHGHSFTVVLSVSRCSKTRTIIHSSVVSSAVQFHTDNRSQ